MIKVYSGERASGKTTRLVKQAAALTEDEKIPVFLTHSRVYYTDIILYDAKRFNIDTSSWINFTARDLQDLSKLAELYAIAKNRNYRLFLDEEELFIANLLNLGSETNLYISHDSTLDVEIKRSDWDENYKENK